MSSAKDVTGQKFGRLTVTSCAGKTPQGQLLWNCVCECGNTHVARGSSLRSGRLRSCGCLRRDEARERFTKHGYGKFVKRTKEYRVWLNMRDRCHNPNNPGWTNYGGRGIRVCSRWNSFNDFLKDMGKCPPAKSIDRIDNNGNYEPSNCRWATCKEQANNQRNRKDGHYLTINGVNKSAAYWGRIAGVSRNAVLARLKRGWSLEEAACTPYKWGGRSHRIYPQAKRWNKLH